MWAMRSPASGGPAAPRDRRARLGAGAAALGVHVLLGLAFLRGLAAPSAPPPAQAALDIFDIAPPAPSEPLRVDLAPPPPAAEARDEARAGAPEREGAAAPPDLRSEATQIVAPPPVITLPVPPPVTAAPVAGTGSAPDQGAALVRGPGFGAGGVGDGRGAGRGGDGPGGGGEGGRGLGRHTPPRHLSGRLSDRDYPRAAGEAGVSGTVSVRFTVGVAGRVTDCWITRSSGSRLLDITTCRLIERRYRFAPSRDAAGRPVAADMIEDHEWLSYPDREAR